MGLRKEREKLMKKLEIKGKHCWSGANQALPVQLGLGRIVTWFKVEQVALIGRDNQLSLPYCLRVEGTEEYQFFSL